MGGRRGSARAPVPYRRAVEAPPETLMRADVAVVGAGAAGLFAALVAADLGANVALVSRSPLAQTASFWAQGGIAAALGEGDSPELHVADTLAAGRGAARESAVRVLCEESPARVHELEALGVTFDADRHGNLALGLEGGHSLRRIVHAGGSATGRRITRELSAKAAMHERIQVLEPAACVALWTLDGRCIGLLARRRDGAELPVLARATVLATGGMAALWERTTNPAGAIGAGLGLAEAAGARLADLEFLQFHPTALRTGGVRDGFLITEAVRGEGAKLLDAQGERFVDELAPRDHVALAIEAELARSGERAVGLDLRGIDLGRFPNIAAALAEVGIDPAREPRARGAGGPLHDGRRGHRPRRALHAARSLRRGRERVQRPPRSQPPGVELARRVLRLRPPRRARRVCRARAAGRPRAAPRSPASRPSRRTPRARPCGATPGSSATPRACAELSLDPFPLARLIATACLAREESRGAHQRTDHPATDPGLDRTHNLVGGSLAPAFETWT